MGAEDRSSTDGTELSDAPAAEAPTGDAPAAEGAPARTSILERRMAASDLMRLATAGSVDDGKSTLIGRLLFDSKTLFIDQLAAVERVSTAVSVDEGMSRLIGLVLFDSMTLFIDLLAAVERVS